MMPRKIVNGGASSNPAFLKASPNAKIPEPTLPLNRCIMVSRYLQLSNYSSLVRSIYSKLDNVNQDESSDISGIPVIIEIMAMNQDMNKNVWYAFQICQERIM